MSQVFLTPNFNDDPRIRRVGTAGVGTYVLSLAAANEENFVYLPAELAEGTELLVEAGLWSPAEDGYYIRGEGELFVRELPEGATCFTASVE